MELKNVEDYYPLSPLQEGMLFHSLFAPGSGVYCEQVVLTFHGSLDVLVFKNAWHKVVERHSVLRTAFVYEGLKELIQVVREQVSLPFEELNWRSLPPEEQSQRLKNLLQVDRRRDFELSNAPLMRLVLVQVAETSYKLIWSYHHLLLDGWSVPLVLKEVFTLCAAFSSNQETHLQQIRPFKDYIKWLKRQDMSKAKLYWSNTLKGFNGPTTIGVQKLPTGSPDGIGDFDYQEIKLSSSETAALKAFGRQNHLTLNTITQGAWALMLARYSGEEDVVFGATVAGRPAELEGVESMVGVFINTLPVRVRVSGDNVLLPWLRQLQTHLARMREYDYAPLVKVQGWSNVPQGLFESLLVFENFPMNSLKTEHNGSLKIGESRYITQTNYPLTLLVVPEPEFTVRIIYDRNLFEDSAISRMMGNFQNVIENFVTNPDLRLADISLLTATERSQLLEDWNATEKAYPKNMTLIQLFEEQVARSPEAVAVEYEDAQLTYRELNVRANQLAHHLMSLGVGPEVMVGLYMERSLELVIGIYGILKAGGAYVPLDPEYPPDRVAFMVEDTQISIVLTQKHFVMTLPVQGSKVICVDSDWGFIAGESIENPHGGATPKNLAYVIYTSGSTGKPKGVMNEHRGIVNRLLWMQDEYRLTPEDRVLQKTPFSFDVSVWEFFWPLQVGASLIIAKPGGHRDSSYLIKLIVERGITTLHFVPSMLRIFLEEEDVRLCTSLKRVICSGEALPFNLQQRFFEMLDTELHNLYGPTEAAVDVTYWPCQPESGSKIVPIGFPIANTRLYILDPNLSPMPIGCTGELHIGGVQVARGYLNRPELTAEKFIPDPFSDRPDDRLYKTGDLARYLPDGSIEYLGRTDFQVKVRGLRVELGEIESRLSGLDAVKECVVAMREDSPGDQRIVAYYVARENLDILISEWRNYLRTKLPDYMVPQHFVALESIPISPNGKVDRKALPRPDVGVAGKNYVAPQTDIERQIVDIWQEVLKQEKIGINDNFFDIGGQSLLMIQIRTKLQKAFKKKIPLVELFQYPTIDSMCNYLCGSESRQTSIEKIHERAKRQEKFMAHRKQLQKIRDLKEDKIRMEDMQNEIAIIGMSGRFPGSPDIDRFWHNLREGKECISFFSDDELSSSGTDPALISHPDYVKAKGIVDNIEIFDAEFFGYTPREAEVSDPQQRLFMECAWEALENSGYDSENYDGLIGVYAGASPSTYLINNLLPNRQLLDTAGNYQTMIGNHQDYISTRVSYKLNLKGPSLTIQTACSTSLVAVAQACQSLLGFQCDIALAGGVSLTVPQKRGYLYVEGMISSPDGHCRAFDGKAQGAVWGEGVGIVVLKRLVDALADGDQVRAVIKGTAVNNDGSSKVGFTAPSVDGQVEVIAMAQAIAGIDAGTISYVEAHGTGTPIGDPIELAALTKAFRFSTERKGYCGIGSLKTNIGHTDAAAGVAGLIKTVLALEHRQLPPSLHFDKPNPEIDFENSPFYVVATLSEWKQREYPRRAGVSSFGIGGTNAHVIVEEAPAREPSSSSRPWQLLVLSAKTDTALEATSRQLGNYLKNQGFLDFADVIFTLQTGRRRFSHRRFVVCSDHNDAIKALEAPANQSVFTKFEKIEKRPVVFMFPGQGSQYVNMALELYQQEPTFREQVDLCAEIIETHSGYDIRDLLFPEIETKAEAALKLKQTAYTQPAVFLIEYAMARLLNEWGIRPKAMIGHSIGEYVAACLSGVFSLEEALSLVILRGKLIQTLPTGSMLAVGLSEEEIRPLLNNEISLAAVNSPQICVISGAEDDIERIEEKFVLKGVSCKHLYTSHAFHSKMMEPILPVFEKHIKKFNLKSPEMKYISNVTGTWITPEQAIDPKYWVNHLRQTVLFSAGIEEVLKDENSILLQVGPGRALTTLVLQQTNNPANFSVFPTMRHVKEDVSDLAYLLKIIGRMWLAGVNIDWSGFYKNEQRLRVPLPSYPFERKRYWVEPGNQKNRDHEKSSFLTQNEEKTLQTSRPSDAILNELLINNGTATNTTTESILAGIWQKVLGIENISIYDNFFEIGGNSLLVIQVVALIKHETGTRIHPEEFVFQTLTQIAALLDTKMINVPVQKSPIQANNVDLKISQDHNNKAEYFFFGTSSKSLFGGYHRPDKDTGLSCGVLLCYPYGHEYIRAYRAYRQLASKLALNGFHVFRFDYYGCGDSSNDISQARISDWLENIELAAEEIRKRAGLTQLFLSGLRLGGTLAVMAAQKIEDISGFVLWEPVVSGKSYLNELEYQQSAYVASMHREYRQLFSGEITKNEILGFEITPLMARDIKKIDMMSSINSTNTDILMLLNDSKQDKKDLMEFLLKGKNRITVEIIDEQMLWLERPYKALVPVRSIQTIVSWLNDKVK